jgi:hypothetical protein
MCDATKQLQAGGGWLMCSTPGVSHQWHYDEADDVSWKEGRPED